MTGSPQKHDPEIQGTLPSVGGEADEGNKADPAGKIESTQPAYSSNGTGQAAIDYPSGIRLQIICIALGLALFIAGLDATIISTAISRITDEWHALEDVGWPDILISNILLTTCSTLLFFGKLYTYFSVKIVFLTAIGLLELGSLVCATAPSSAAFIVGRAIAGIGCAGIGGGTLILVSLSIPLHLRPLYGGLLGGAEGLAIVVAPLIGGALTENVSWRWCFWINLPIGGASFLVILLFFKPPDRPTLKLTFKEKLNSIDLHGTAVLIPSIVCLLLALQWGGSKYPWRSGRIIALFVVFGITLLIFLGIQHRKKDGATVPFRIIRQRTVGFSVLFGLCTAAASNVLSYYLPLWFQAIKEVTPLKSGIMLLPTILATILSGISTGAIITKIGYYTPFMILASVLMSIGAGLMTTLKVGSSAKHWIGYQVIFGLGTGMGIQQPMVSVQVVLAQQDIPVGVSTVMFGNALGGTIFLSIANNIFINRLREGVQVAVPGIDPSIVVNTGATELVLQIPSAFISGVLYVYNKSVTQTFYLLVALGCLAMIGALGTEWKSVKSQKPAEPPAEPPAEQQVEKSEEMPEHKSNEVYNSNEASKDSMEAGTKEE
ncbi:hypothetical protein B7463_g9527, partial [Scytalidium lignicola]